MKKRGFTLIELLVAVAILAILSTVGLSMLSGAQKKARDAARKAGLKAIQNAAESYYIDNELYPANTGAFATLIDGGYPTDPRDGVVYSLGAGHTATGYQVCADLEVGDADWQNDDTEFCVTNRQ